MVNEDWKYRLLKYILVIGSTTLALFSAVYFNRGNFQIALIEGVTAFVLVVSFFMVGKYYILPAVLGWIGVYVVLTTLLVTGGIDGSGTMWWALIPIISYIMFGLLGGVIATIFSVLTLLILGTLDQLGVAKLFFEVGQIRQTGIMVSVIGAIMYYFEKISGSARQEALDKSRLLEEASSKMKHNINELAQERVSQDNIRKAVLNILEDTKQIGKDLEFEKKNVENRVSERTQELAEEKAKFIASINSIVKAYVLLDLSGKVVLVNNKLSEFLGGVDGEWTLDIIQNKLENKVNLNEIFKQAKAGNKFSFKEIEVGTKFYDLYMSPIFLSKDDLIGVLLMVGDITEEKVIDRSRDEFFSIASHELRTPLTAIRGNASLIKQMYLDKIKDPDLSEMISDIHESSIRLIGIVNDFLNVSRLEMGRMEFKKDKFDIVQLVNDVISEVDDKNDNIDIKLAQPLNSTIAIVGDKDRTKEVLINLIGNGVKYSEKGVVKISLKVSGREAIVYVEDSGRGIPAENQKLLFHKFQQAGSSLYTRDTTKSTGLGLYISKLMTEGMGGKIWLEKSIEGKGSVFAFSLPVSI